jgi:hypothetical protein
MTDLLVRQKMHNLIYPSVLITLNSLTLALFHRPTPPRVLKALRWQKSRTIERCVGSMRNPTQGRENQRRDLGKKDY